MVFRLQAKELKFSFLKLLDISASLIHFILSVYLLMAVLLNLLIIYTLYESVMYANVRLLRLFCFQQQAKNNYTIRIR